MIRNEKEYRQAVERICQEKNRLARQQAELKKMGLGPAEIKRALDPMRSFHQQLQEEVAGYERLKRGEFDETLNLRGLGQLLVSLRIASGLTQRQLAAKLGVHETQVSRDERNEYHGITLERAAKILEALGVELRSRVERVDHAPAEVALQPFSARVAYSLRLGGQWAGAGSDRDCFPRGMGYHQRWGSLRFGGGWGKAHRTGCLV